MPRAVSIAALAVLACGTVVVAAGRTPADAALSLDDRPESAEFGTVAVTGLPAAPLAALAARLAPLDWERVLAVRMVRPAGTAGSDAPPVLGAYAIEGDTLRFRPRFPISAGMAFEARFDGRLFDEWIGAAAGDTPALAAIFTMPAPAAEAVPHVVAVYPSATELPENLLRVYVHFSGPVFPKHIHERVRLLDSAGHEVELPFVEVEGGLWDPEQRRLTLFLHPGRIKRGVAPNAELGPPLRAGSAFRLTIDGGGTGATASEVYEKRILALPPDRTPPDPASFTVTEPRRADDPLTLDFPEPLDHALLGRLIEVLDASGAPLAGRVAISRGETRFTFLPDRPWSRGDYVVLVDPALEDLAGNSVARPFEQPEGTVSEDPPVPVEIPFRVEPR